MDFNPEVPRSAPPDSKRRSLFRPFSRRQNSSDQVSTVLHKWECCLRVTTKILFRSFSRKAPREQMRMEQSRTLMGRTRRSAIFPATVSPRETGSGTKSDGSKRVSHPITAVAASPAATKGIQTWRQSG